jgi:hypothetical protein
VKRISRAKGSDCNCADSGPSRGNPCRAGFRRGRAKRLFFGDYAGVAGKRGGVCCRFCDVASSVPFAQKPRCNAHAIDPFTSSGRRALRRASDERRHRSPALWRTRRPVGPCAPRSPRAVGRRPNPWCTKSPTFARSRFFGPRRCSPFPRPPAAVLAALWRDPRALLEVDPRLASAWRSDGCVAQAGRPIAYGRREEFLKGVALALVSWIRSSSIVGNCQPPGRVTTLILSDSPGTLAKRSASEAARRQPKSQFPRDQAVKQPCSHVGRDGAPHSREQRSRAPSSPKSKVPELERRLQSRSREFQRRPRSRSRMCSSRPGRFRGCTKIRCPRGSTPRPKR